MIAPRKRPATLVALAVFALLIFFYPREPGYIPIVSKFSSQRPLGPADRSPANSTLGFGAILAVSKEGSSRRPGLLQAANVTDIDITIPKQPVWTDQQVDEFRNGEEAGTRGSILAWMGHHNALRWYARFVCHTSHPVANLRFHSGSSTPASKRL
jgi:hypothetical protein